MQQYVNYDELIKLMHMNICCFSVMFSNKKNTLTFISTIDIIIMQILMADKKILVCVTMYQEIR